jgi:hypothetical protein
MRLAICVMVVLAIYPWLPIREQVEKGMGEHVLSISALVRVCTRHIADNSHLRTPDDRGNPPVGPQQFDSETGSRYKGTFRGQRQRRYKSWIPSDAVVKRVSAILHPRQRTASSTLRQPTRTALTEISLPATTREFMCVSSLRPGAATGVAYPIPRCNGVILHEEPEMGLGTAGAGECLPDRCRRSRTG